MDTSTSENCKKCEKSSIDEGETTGNIIDVFLFAPITK